MFKTFQLFGMNFPNRHIKFSISSKFVFIGRYAADKMYDNKYWCKPFYLGTVVCRSRKILASSKIRRYKFWQISAEISYEVLPPFVE